MTTLPELDDEVFAGLERDVPVAMLPVRLEVRFGTRKFGDPSERIRMPVLRVRIYPDDNSIKRDRSELTQAEVGVGKEYWHDFASIKDDASKPVARRALDSGAKRNRFKRSGFERLRQALRGSPEMAS